MHLKIGYWIPLAVVITLLSGLIYGMGQQILRVSANDPQISLAQQNADFWSNADLKKIADEHYFNGPDVDPRTSLETFSMDFDKNGQLLHTNWVHDPVTIPPGVLDYARTHSQHRLTWEPLPGVRIATVVIHYSGKNSGFVLVGRSLKEVESRIDNLGKMVALGWLITLAASFLATLLFVPKPSKK